MAMSHPHAIVYVVESSCAATSPLQLGLAQGQVLSASRFPQLGKASKQTGDASDISSSHLLSKLPLF